MKTLYFDCFSGAAGDMIVGALIDAGADFQALKRGLDSLGVTGYTVTAEKIQKHHQVATHFIVKIDDEHHPHRHLRHIVEIIDRGDLPIPVKDASKETFRRIAECEAQIHGTTVEKIHFHEVGAIDSIVDIVGSHLALHLLGVKRIVSSPLPVGFGTLKCDHGVMPVPAPATAMLLRGVPAYGGDVQGELVTPTGAALIAQLASAFGPMPPMRVEAVGYGSGTRDLPDRPNVLRVLLGDAEELLASTETVLVIETNIDDMSPEMFPPLLNDLLAKGARDAFITPILGKKGRPGYLFTVLSDESRKTEMLEAIFRGSTTLGVRMRTEHRVCLEREFKTIETKWGKVRVKLGRFRGQLTVFAPEFEDCLKAANAAGVSILTVFEAARAAAIGGETHHA